MHFKDLRRSCRVEPGMSSSLVLRGCRRKRGGERGATRVVSLLGYLRRLPQHHPVPVADEVAALAVGQRPARLQRTGPEE
jgi:hypothetical protein